MPNAKDIKSERANILIIGDAGTHKTHFLGSIPGVYVFDFDAGMLVNRGRDIEYDTFKDVDRYEPSGHLWIADAEMNKSGLYTYGHGWDAFYAKFYQKVELIRKRDPKAPKALGFDSLTMMSMLAVDKILKDTNQPMPHQGTWGAHHEYFKRIFSMTTALPVRLIATAHIQRDENDLTGIKEKLPLLTGKLAPLIPIFFDEVWFTETEKQSNGTLKYSIYTSRTPQMTQAKSRHAVPDGSLLDWITLSKFFPV